MPPDVEIMCKSDDRDEQGASRSREAEEMNRIPTLGQAFLVHHSS